MNVIERDPAGPRPLHQVDASQPVYLTIADAPGERLDLLRLWRALSEGRWIIAGCITLAVIAALAYSWLAVDLYEAETLLVPAHEQAEGPLTGLGGLINVPGLALGNDQGSAEAVAIVQSRKFIGDFIREHDLLPILFAERWDAAKRAWKHGGDEAPELPDGVKFFLEHILTVSTDRQTGFVTLAIEWRDGSLAAEWAGKLVVAVNETKRRRDIDEAQRKLEYLNGQLQTATLLETRQAVSKVIEEQINAMTIAHARSEYAFRVVDPAVAPKDKTWPQPILIVIAALVLGTLVGFFIVLLRHVRQIVSAARE